VHNNNFDLKDLQLKNYKNFEKSNDLLKI